MSDLERLERLEQSITQLLYQIDASFSSSHRIITGSILPVVEQYAQHSASVWEHARFWKEFFEQSASVAVSGYVEDAHEEQMYAQDDASMLDHDETRQTPRQGSLHASAQSPVDLTGEEEESYAESPQLALQTTLQDAGDLTTTSAGTPPRDHANESSTPAGSPSYYNKTPRTAKSTGKSNRLLHRVLDSNWRVQATPLKSIYPQSTSPVGSPPILTNMDRLSMRDATPSKRYEEDDDDSSLGQMSPPVTMAFSLPPSKLLRTPAKEAARHMVNDILRTAGAGDLSSLPSHAGGSLAEGSSSRRLFDDDATPVVKRGGGNLDAWQASQSEDWGY